MSIKSTNVTNYSVLVDGELANFSESRWNKFVEKEIKEGRATPVPEKVQTFVTYEAETVADITELVPNEEVAVSLFNRGASLKQLTEIRGQMEDPKFTTSEAAYDLREALNAVTERRAASPEDRVASLLDKLDDAALARIMEKLMEKSTTPRT